MSVKTSLEQTATVKKTLVSESDAPNVVSEYTEQDVEPIIALAKAQSEMKPSDEMRLVGHIPIVVWEEMQRDGRANDPQAIKAWLNDYANRCFRVTKGRV